MSELLDIIASAVGKFETRVPSTIIYAGRSNNSFTVLNPEFRPSFVDPGAESQQG